jgi:hypothetical protein
MSRHELEDCVTALFDINDEKEYLTLCAEWGPLAELTSIYLSKREAKTLAKLIMEQP